MTEKAPSVYSWGSFTASEAERRKEATQLQTVPDRSLDSGVIWMIAMFLPFVLAPATLVVIILLHFVGVETWAPW